EPDTRRHLQCTNDGYSIRQPLVFQPSRHIQHGEIAGLVAYLYAGGSGAVSAGFDGQAAESGSRRRGLIRDSAAGTGGKGESHMTIGKAVAVAVLGLWSTASEAQESQTSRNPGMMAQRGTAEEQAACRPDVRRFCRDIPDNAGPLFFLACLRENR